MRFKNLPRNSVLYAERALLWNRDSSPFLSGDVFAKGSDLSLFPPRFRRFPLEKRQISDAQVIFCPSHKIEDFIEIYGPATRAKVLILGNSDRDFTSPIQGLPPSIKKVFCQNLLFEDSRYQVLPIGIENLRLAKNGKMHLYRAQYFEQSKENQVLLGPFSNTHSERAEIDFTNLKSEILVPQFNRMEPLEYARFASGFNYIAAPRGNGMDTHRFWETLYRGGIPIVKQSSWSKQIAALNFPIIQIVSWDPDYILTGIQKNSNLKADRNLPQLWWPWWEKFIRSFI